MASVPAWGLIPSSTRWLGANPSAPRDLGLGFAKLSCCPDLYVVPAHKPPWEPAEIRNRSRLPMVARERSWRSGRFVSQGKLG